jgi:hypothetical protein
MKWPIGGLHQHSGPHAQIAQWRANDGVLALLVGPPVELLLWRRLLEAFFFLRERNVGRRCGDGEGQTNKGTHVLSPTDLNVAYSAPWSGESMCLSETTRATKLMRTRTSPCRSHWDTFEAAAGTVLCYDRAASDHERSKLRRWWDTRRCMPETSQQDPEILDTAGSFLWISSTGEATSNNPSGRYPTRSTRQGDGAEAAVIGAP